MDWKQFGRALLETQDLDPVYVMLARAELNQAWLRRWLLAYWCFYHAGVATAAASCGIQGVYYNYLRGALKEAPRGSERRHFRGEKARHAIDWLSQFNPELLVNSMVSYPTFQEVEAAARSVPMFGPWIAFKVADMAERVLRQPIDFSGCDVVAFYDEPKKGALKVAQMEGWPLDAVVPNMLKEFKGYRAPPYFDRGLNVQEMETILCKWKSHLNGHYEMGKDTHEIGVALSYHKGQISSRLKGLLP